MARILVVEDDEKLNQIMCAYLARSGYQATGCHRVQRNHRDSCRRHRQHQRRRYAHALRGQRGRHPH